MARYVTELVGTFFLVFAVGMAAVLGTAAAPLAIGSMLMVMVYMGGHVSGAHYNPAVSVAVFLRGKLDAGDLLPYVLAQLGGGVLAATAVFVITGESFAPAPGADYGLAAAVLAEVVFTFALVLVILAVATHPATEGNSYYGLAIGFTVAAGAWAVGPVSGGVFNPAVGLGPILMAGLLEDDNLLNALVYLAAPIAGGLAAVPVFRMQLPPEPATPPLA